MNFIDIQRLETLPRIKENLDFALTQIETTIKSEHLESKQQLSDAQEFNQFAKAWLCHYIPTDPALVPAVTMEVSKLSTDLCKVVPAMRLCAAVAGLRRISATITKELKSA